VNSFELAEFAFFLLSLVHPELFDLFPFFYVLALKFLLVKKSLIRIFFFFFYVSMNENKLLAPRLTERHGHQTEQKKLKSIARETIRQGAVEEYLLSFFVPLFPHDFLPSSIPPP
jgi:hypothetical protein